MKAIIETHSIEGILALTISPADAADCPVDEYAFSNPERAAEIEQTRAKADQRTAFVQQIDRAPHLPEASPKPLLIMNNDFDLDQPKYYSIELYREKPENLRLGIYPPSHQVTSKWKMTLSSGSAGIC